MNAPMPKHYELQLQQLVQPPDNHHISNQHPFPTQRILMAEGTNFDELFTTDV
jgi:hypothetical protein